jgi:hypothetical protein
VGRVAYWITNWILLWILYLLLVFKTEPAEIAVGALCGAIGATAAEVVRAQASVRFAPGRGWWRGMRRLPRELVVDTWLLIVVLWRVVVRREDVRGRWITMPFPGVQGDGSEAVSRRAVAKWFGSVAPNTLVAGFEEDAERILLHQLVATDEPPVCDPWEKPRS